MRRVGGAAAGCHVYVRAEAAPVLCAPPCASLPCRPPSSHPSLPTRAPARSPMFVLPVFKGPNAFENFMVQCQLPLVLFTTLEEYKL